MLFGKTSRFPGFEPHHANGFAGVGNRGKDTASGAVFHAAQLLDFFRLRQVERNSPEFLGVHKRPERSDVPAGDNS